MKSTKEKHNGFIINKSNLYPSCLSCYISFFIPSKKEQIGLEKMEMPEAMEELADEENIEWMAASAKILINGDTSGVEE